MKRIIYTLTLITILGLSFTACTTKDNKVERPSDIEIFSRRWKLTNIYLEENNNEVKDVSAYDGMIIEASSDGTYKVQNGGNAFPNPSSTWEFVQNDLGSDIIFDAGTDTEVVAHFTTLEADQLNFSFMREGSTQTASRMVIPDRYFEISMSAF